MLVAIEQRISAGQQFTGDAPTTTATELKGAVKSYAAGSVGGLFEPDKDVDLSARVFALDRIDGKFPNGVVTIKILRGSDEVLVYSGTPAGDLILLAAAGDIPSTLARDEKIKITTAGASSAMVARVSGRAASSSSDLSLDTGR
jgi:hypothetical protein